MWGQRVTRTVHSDILPPACYWRYYCRPISHCSSIGCRSEARSSDLLLIAKRCSHTDRSRCRRSSSNGSLHSSCPPLDRSCDSSSSSCCSTGSSCSGKTAENQWKLWKAFCSCDSQSGRLRPVASGSRRRGSSSRCRSESSSNIRTSPSCRGGSTKSSSGRIVSRSFVDSPLSRLQRPFSSSSSVSPRARPRHDLCCCSCRSSCRVALRSSPALLPATSRGWAAAGVSAASQQQRAARPAAIAARRAAAAAARPAATAAHSQAASGGGCCSIAAAEMTGCRAPTAADAATHVSAGARSRRTAIGAPSGEKAAAPAPAVFCAAAAAAQSAASCHVTARRAAGLVAAKTATWRSATALRAACVSTAAATECRNAATATAAAAAGEGCSFKRGEAPAKIAAAGGRGESLRVLPLRLLVWGAGAVGAVVLATAGWWERRRRRLLQEEFPQLQQRFQGDTPFYGKLWGYSTDFFVHRNLADGDLVFFSYPAAQLPFREAVLRWCCRTSLAFPTLERPLLAAAAAASALLPRSNASNSINSSSKKEKEEACAKYGRDSRESNSCSNNAADSSSGNSSVGESSSSSIDSNSSSHSGRSGDSSGRRSTRGSEEGTGRGLLSFDEVGVIYTKNSQHFVVSLRSSSDSGALSAAAGTAAAGERRVKREERDAAKGRKGARQEGEGGGLQVVEYAEKLAGSHPDGLCVRRLRCSPDDRMRVRAAIEAAIRSSQPEEQQQQQEQQQQHQEQKQQLLSQQKAQAEQQQPRDRQGHLLGVAAAWAAAEAHDGSRQSSSSSSNPHRSTKEKPSSSSQETSRASASDSGIELPANCFGQSTAAATGVCLNFSHTRASTAAAWRAELLRRSLAGSSQFEEAAIAIAAAWRWAACLLLAHRFEDLIEEVATWGSAQHCAFLREIKQQQQRLRDQQQQQHKRENDLQQHPVLDPALTGAPEQQQQQQTRQLLPSGGKGEGGGEAERGSAAAGRTQTDGAEQVKKQVSKSSSSRTRDTVFRSDSCSPVNGCSGSREEVRRSGSSRCSAFDEEDDDSRRTELLLRATVVFHDQLLQSAEAYERFLARWLPRRAGSNGRTTAAAAEAEQLQKQQNESQQQGEPQQQAERLLAQQQQKRIFRSVPSATFPVAVYQAAGLLPALPAAETWTPEDLLAIDVLLAPIARVDAAAAAASLLSETQKQPLSQQQQQQPRREPPQQQQRQTRETQRGEREAQQQQRNENEEERGKKEGQQNEHGEERKGRWAEEVRAAETRLQAWTAARELASLAPSLAPVLHVRDDRSERVSQVRQCMPSLLRQRERRAAAAAASSSAVGQDATAAAAGLQSPKS